MTNSTTSGLDNTTVLDGDDLLLVSKKSGGTYLSRNFKYSVIQNAINKVVTDLSMTKRIQDANEVQLGAGANGWAAMLVQDASGKNQQQINDMGAAYWRNVAYPINARVMLDNGIVVRSTIAANTGNPNASMTGWKLENVISVRDFITDPLSTDHTSAFVALNNYFADKTSVEFTLEDMTYNINISGLNLFNFTNKTSVVVHCGSSVINDLTSYATGVIRNIFKLDTCQAVNFTGVLTVNGTRTATTEGEQKGARVITPFNCNNVTASVRSTGNSAAVYNNLSSSCKNWNLDIESTHDHYPLVTSNVENLTANINSVDSYRSVFLMGTINGAVNLNSTGQIGRSLIRAYYNHAETRNLTLNATYKNVAPYISTEILSIEIQSDTPVSFSDVRVNITCLDSPDATNYKHFNIVNLTETGAYQTVAIGHSLRNISLTGSLNTSATSNVEPFPRNTFFAGDTVEKLKISNLNIKGGGTLSLRMDTNDGIDVSNLTMLDGSLLFYPSLTTHRVEKSEIGTMAVGDSGKVIFKDCNILSANNMDKVGYIFQNTTVAGVVVNRLKRGAIERKSVVKSGDLSCGVVVTTTRGQVRCVGKLKYFVISDIAAFTNNYESGEITFKLYVTAGGSVTLSDVTKTVIVAMGVAANVTLTAVANASAGELTVTSVFNAANSRLTAEVELLPIPIDGSFYTFS